MSPKESKDFVGVTLVRSESDFCWGHDGVHDI